MTERTHGSRACYLTGCREEPCVAANTQYYREWRDAAPTLEPDDPRHGSLNGYRNYGCPCRRCKDANTASSRERRARERGLL